MGTADRKEREKAQRRQDILDAAERVFIQKGFQSATMDDIAADAELSKGTLYSYFKSKEELILNLELRGTLTMRECFKEAIAEVDTGIERVLAIGRSYLQFVQDFPLYFQMMNYCGNNNPGVIEILEKESIYATWLEEDKKTLDIFLDAITSGMADGTIADDIDPMETAILLWSMCNGVFQFYHVYRLGLETQFGINPEFLYDRFSEFVAKALTPESGL